MSDRPGEPDYVPNQVQGKESDVIDTVDYASEDEAMRAFRQTRAHMLDVNRWFRQMTDTAPIRTLGGLNPLVPVFSLVDKPGASAAVGDVIRIAAGGQDMFVHIEAIIDQADEFAIRVRPCEPDGSEAHARHMYTPDATNTFCLARDGRTLTTRFLGRNEVVNDGVTSTLADAGMSLGGRQFNWKLLGEAWRP